MVRNEGEEISDLLVAAFLVCSHILDDAVRGVDSGAAQCIEAEIFFECCTFDDLWTSVEETPDICGDDAEVTDSRPSSTEADGLLTGQVDDHAGFQ